MLRGLHYCICYIISLSSSCRPCPLVNRHQDIFDPMLDGLFQLGPDGVCRNLYSSWLGLTAASTFPNGPLPSPWWHLLLFSSLFGRTQSSHHVFTGKYLLLAVLKLFLTGLHFFLDGQQVFHHLFHFCCMMILVLTAVFNPVIQLNQPN
jgi:hypothetical protein